MPSITKHTENTKTTRKHDQSAYTNVHDKKQKWTVDAILQEGTDTVVRM